MSVCVFLGPTLDVAEARRTLDASFLPPAARGDIYRAACRRPRPRIIALVDGKFRSQPAVRHKEILFALAEGIHVFGAASMGALRAAELAEFGMAGVGAIFEALRSGELEDDDEVAVEHGPAELGFAATSEAMVDIRATLNAALARSIIGPGAHAALVAAAKEMFYGQRSLEAVLRQPGVAGLAVDDVATLRRWLMANRISQKRLDALSMLQTIRAFLATDPPPFRARFDFEFTVAFLDDVDQAVHAGAVGHHGHAHLDGDILDELRLAPALFNEARREALARGLAVRAAHRRRIGLTQAEVDAEERQWVREKRLQSPQRLDAWRIANHLDEAGFRGFIAEEARCRALAKECSGLIAEHLANALRSRGAWAPLAARAAEKARVLAEASLGEATLQDLGLTAADLVRWFAEEILRQPIPVDVEAYRQNLGFADDASFHRALLREFLFARECKSGRTGAPPQQGKGGTFDSARSLDLSYKAPGARGT